MKQVYCLLLLLATTITFSASGQSIWEAGNTLGVSAGIYGDLGVPAASNIPGARQGSITWTGKNGNFYLFGGLGVDVNGTPGGLNDLWRYNPTLKQWTWLSGDSVVNKPGNYGVKGTPGGKPGVRNKAMSWTDAAGDLWFFGGEESSGGLLHNDLWLYTVSSNQWTWMGGDNTMNKPGVYGSKGAPGANNIPGARHSAVCWMDRAGKFWLCGGQGYNTSALQETYLNDLWKYDPVQNEWTWVGGENSLPNPAGDYGVQGTAAATNMPGGRLGATGWVDANSDLWMFGGYRVDNSTNDELLNDLWKFDTLTKEWTWVSGSSSPNQNGIYGTKGTADNANIPGARNYCNSWIDASGNVFLFAGFGIAGNQLGPLGDFWKYNAVTNQWTWVDGTTKTDQPGVYGAQGIVDPSNVIGCRTLSAVWSTIDALYIFGGVALDATGSFGEINDFWSTSLPKLLPVVLSRFSAQKQNDVVLLKWTTQQESNSETFIIERAVSPGHFVPVGSCAAAYYSNHPLHYSFTDAHPAAGKNYYRLKQVDADGHTAYSITVVVDMNNNATARIRMYPNPATTTVTIELPSAEEQGQLYLYDLQGRLVLSKRVQHNEQVSVQKLLPGIYQAKIVIKGVASSMSIVRQ